MDKQETRADILAEMRQHIQAARDYPQDIDITTGDVEDWADRIEAAAKRERAVTDAMLACKGKMFPHPDPEHAPPPHPAAAADMRAALEKIVRIAEEWDTPGIHAVQTTLYRILEAARAALGAPARNCDRYRTEAEAEAAFDRFCAKERNGQCKPWECPLKSTGGKYCYVAWLLAPAEEGGKE